jgi:hypothetical protein
MNNSQKQRRPVGVETILNWLNDKKPKNGNPQKIISIKRIGFNSKISKKIKSRKFTPFSKSLTFCRAD